LPPLQEIDEGAMVIVVSHGEEHIVAIPVALDDDLVGAAPQHRAAPPALAPVHLVAQTDGKLAQINPPFEGIELAIRIHKTPFPSLLPIFLFPHWFCAAVAAASLVRQLRGPHLSTCP
jgi:hypothetical protein